MGVVVTFGSSSILRLTRMIRVEFADESIASLLVLIHDGVIEGILVLLQPSRDVVRHRTSIMSHGKVTLCISKQQ